MIVVHFEFGLWVGNCYELISWIVGGGMGEVWCVCDGVFGCEVVVKLLRCEYVDDEIFFERFWVEVCYVVFLSYLGIVLVYDYGEDVGIVFFGDGAC